MLNLIPYLIERGISQETIILVLMLPVIATAITFIRQVIGLKAFGLYTPLIITFAFIATGLKYGLIIFVSVVLVGILTRFLLKYLHLLYLPRMAIVLTCVALTILLVFLIGALFEKNVFLAVSILPILIITSLVEKFVAAQIDKGTRMAVMLTIETILLSLFCFYLTSWQWLQNIILKYPFGVLLFTLAVNILLGRWTGLRLTEYIRFRKIIEYAEMAEKE
jgi:hypothetical protein